tara:strand:+ start:7197 stop:8045 length:849 start_codon:yes stop_codon:yes gene_type:complete
MKIIDGCVKLHPSDPKTLIKPHFDDDGFFNITSVESQWDEFTAAINNLIEPNSAYFTHYVANRLGSLISQMYNVHVSQPRPEYNIVVSKGVVSHDGSIAARYDLYMPGKVMFQDAHIDPSWVGLLSLAKEPTIDPVYFDMLDGVYARYRNSLDGKYPFVDVVDVHIGDTYYGRTTCKRASGTKGELVAGEEIPHSQLPMLKYAQRPSKGEHSGLDHLLGDTPDHADLQRWCDLVLWLTPEVCDGDNFVPSDICAYFMAWYGIEKFNIIVETFKKLRFVVREI